MVTITATDADAGDTLAYSLDSTADAVFNISSSGAITVNVDSGSALDHEATSSYTVTVTASDGTDTATHDVTISVSDVAEAPDAPAAPTVRDNSVAAVTVTWTAPDVTGKPAISDYDVQFKLGSATIWTDHTFESTAVTTSIPNLTANTTYDVRVRATNAEGTSAWSVTGSGSTATNSLPIGSVTIDGTATQGQTLTANTNSVADPDGPTVLTFSYQWKRDGTDITGATASTYVLVQDDVGETIAVKVSWTDAGKTPGEPAVGGDVGGHERQRRADGGGDNHGDGDAGPDADRGREHGGRPGRPGFVQLPVDAHQHGQHQHGHHRRDVLNLRAGAGRRGLDHHGDGELDRRRQHGREPDVGGDLGRWRTSTMRRRGR